jgi:hypothetical protein
MKHLRKIITLVIILTSLSTSYAQVEIIEYEDLETGEWRMNLLDTISNRIISPLRNEYDFFLDYDETYKLIIVSKNNKIGVYSYQGKEIVEPKYKSAKILKGGFIRVITFDKKFGLFNKKGKQISNAVYDYIGQFSSGMVRVAQDIDEIYLEELDYTFESYLDYHDIVSYESEYIEAVGGKWGFIDEKGKVKVPLQYSYVNSFIDGKAIVCVSGYNYNGDCENGSYDLIDRSNKSIIPDNMKIVRTYNKNRFIVKSLNNKYGVVDENGTVIIDAIFNSVFIEANKYIICEIEKGDEFIRRIFNFNGKPLFDNKATYFGIIAKEDENYITTNYITYKEKEKWGLADSSGIKITNPIYNSIEGYNWINNGFLMVSIKSEDSKDNYYGLIDLKGDVVIPVIYDEILSKYSNNNEIAFVLRKGNNVGVVNVKNEIVIPFEYQELKFIDNYNRPASFLAKKDDKYGFIDLQNSKFIDFKYEAVFYTYDLDEIFSNNRIKVLVDGKEGVIDNSGNYIIKPKYREIVNINDNWSRNMVLFKTPKGMGIIDTLGNTIVDPIYANIEVFSDSIIDCTYKEEHLVNLHTNKVQIFEETESHSFSYYDSDGNYQTAILSKINGLYGYINKQSGATIIPFVYQEIFDMDFICGISKVLKGGKYGVVDNTGKEILSPKYESIKMKECDYYSSYIQYIFVKKDGKWGVFNTEGEGVFEGDFIFNTYEEAKKEFPGSEDY